MATASESKLAAGSEELRGPCCTSCTENGDTSTAGHYCVECELYMCVKCLNCHNKIPATKSHQVNDVVCSSQTVQTKEKKQPESKPSQKLRCHVHHGEIVESYCTGHDEMCCRMCVLIKHRTCKVERIAVMEINFKSNPRVKQCKKSLSNILSDLKQELNVRERNVRSIERDKIDMLESVNKYEEKVIAMVSKLAEKSRKQIQAWCVVHTHFVNTDIKLLDAAVATTSKCIGRVTLSENDQLFVDYQAAKLVMKENENVLQTMSSTWRRREVKFKLDKINFDGRESLGKMVDRAEIHEYEATLCKTFCNVVTRRLMDICILESGDIFLIDTDNKSLKRYSSAMEFKDGIYTPAYPVAVCRVSANKVAVRSFGGQVQIITANEAMKVETDFVVESHGYGLGYDTIYEEFFVCEKTKISIYSKAGKKLRILEKTKNGEMLFSECRQIDIDSETKNIYVTDAKRGLLILYRSGNIKSTFTNLALDSPWAFCRLPGDVYLVSDTSSENIVQVNRNGVKIRKLINQFAFCTVYDHLHHRLIVGGRSSLKAFKIFGKSM